MLHKKKLFTFLTKFSRKAIIAKTSAILPSSAVVTVLVCLT